MNERPFPSHEGSGGALWARDLSGWGGHREASSTSAEHLGGLGDEASADRELRGRRA